MLGQLGLEVYNKVNGCYKFSHTHNMKVGEKLWI